MNTRDIVRLAPFPLLAATLLAAGCRDADLPTAASPPEDTYLSEEPAFPRGEPLKVLTRNMYMGGDVGLVFGADFSDPNEVVAAATAVWNQIQATDFTQRAVALAGEIDDARPQVVGIQEIPRYVILNAAYEPVGVQDHLNLLMGELDGLPYDLAAVQTNSEVVMPILLDTGLHYVQYTDRIAVLVRSDVVVDAVDQGIYAAHYQMNPALDLKRGWIRVSTQMAGVPYHFVNTHLEVQAFAPIQALQTQELIQSVTAGLEGVTVLMGDLNSDAAAGPGAPSWTPTYETLLAAGFQDAWLIDHPASPYIGFTCCQESLLDNQVSVLDERIDFILLRATEHRGSSVRLPGAIHVDIVGGDEGDRIFPSGLWPTDHAGLLASLMVPSALFN